MRPGGVAGDGHGLEDHVGVALQHRAVHERAGVAFVGVADDVLGHFLLLRGEKPLLAGGEAGAAATPETRIDHRLDDFLGLLLVQAAPQRLVAVAGDVFLDVQRRNVSAIPERQAKLLLVEIGFRHRQHLGRIGDRLGVEIFPDRLAAHQMLGDDLAHLELVDVRIEDVAGLDHHDGTLRAQTHAAGLDHLHLVRETRRRDFLLERGRDLERSGRRAPAAAHQHARLLRHRRLRLGLQLQKFFQSLHGSLSPLSCTWRGCRRADPP